MRGISELDRSPDHDLSNKIAPFLFEIGELLACLLSLRFPELTFEHES